MSKILKENMVDIISAQKCEPMKHPNPVRSVLRIITLLVVLMSSLMLNSFAQCDVNKIGFFQRTLGCGPGPVEMEVWFDGYFNEDFYFEWYTQPTGGSFETQILADANDEAIYAPVLSADKDYWVGVFYPGGSDYGPLSGGQDS